MFKTYHFIDSFTDLSLLFFSKYFQLQELFFFDSAIVNQFYQILSEVLKIEPKSFLNKLRHQQTLQSFLKQRHVNMKNWLQILLFIGTVSIASADDIAEDASLDTVDLDPFFKTQPLSFCFFQIGLLRKYGYTAENHRIVTADGYILNAHRCSGGPVSAPRPGKPVAFLMHGMLSSSADYTLMGPQTSLVYMLSDLGYDVWMGNSRGNRYSNTHTSLNNETQQYWDFSWHEIAVRDLPAMIDYTLSHTGQSKLHYIGHSMGTTAYLALISEIPSYNSKIISCQLLAPAAYMHNVKSPYVIWMATYLYNMQMALDMMGTYYFAPTNEMDVKAAYDDCRDGAPYQEMCTMTMFLIAGFNSQETNRTMLPVIKAHSPAGASTKNMLHYAQIVRSWQFRQYDHDALNYYRYGQLTPPLYRFTTHTAPVSFYHSTNDWMATPNDVEILYSMMTASRVQLKYLVPQTAFNHMDFVWAINVRSLVYNRVVQDMAKWQATNS